MTGTEPTFAGEQRTHLERTISDALTRRNAAAFVHVGAARDPTVRYCLSVLENACDGDGGGDHDLVLERDQERGQERSIGEIVAIGYDGADDEWLVRGGEGTSHPAARLATALSERGVSGTILTPAAIPHDAALYLENEGFSLASSDAVARARAVKTAGERDRLEAVQAAASAGVRRAAALLADAAVGDDGRVVVGREGAAVTAERLRRAIDEAMISAGAFPAGNTTVDQGADADGALRRGEPIVVAVAPRGPSGYHGGLVRTFVVDSDGGRERRTHVALTQAFRSSRAMVTAGTESVTAVEADLEAEIRAFGEDDKINTNVAGVGLEPAERPIDGADDVEPRSVVRLEAGVELEDGIRIRIADVFANDEDGVSLLDAPSRSLEPRALLDAGDENGA